jgi:predicted phosphodiesterase
MKWALLSDVHANWTAWKACVAHARLQGVTHWAILGDLVGYGPHPSDVVESVREMQATEHAVVLRGNHEEMACRGAGPESLGSQTARWTFEQLTPSQKNWLADLPLTHVTGSMMLVHASANEPARWHYVDDSHSAARSLDAALIQHPSLRHVWGGHVHHQTLYYRGKNHLLMPFRPTPGITIPVPAHRHWLATIGSVGQSRDGNVKAAYAIFDADRNELCFHRIGYDHLATARAIRAVGLPEKLAFRIESGT